MSRTDLAISYDYYGPALHYPESLHRVYASDMLRALSLSPGKDDCHTV